MEGWPDMKQMFELEIEDLACAILTSYNCYKGPFVGVFGREHCGNKDGYKFTLLCSLFPSPAHQVSNSPLSSLFPSPATPHSPSRQSHISRAQQQHGGVSFRWRTPSTAANPRGDVLVSHILAQIHSPPTKDYGCVGKLCWIFDYGCILIVYIIDCRL
ncbi:hypothetical protein Dimus_011508 [Dionaea muscipula]